MSIKWDLVLQTSLLDLRGGWGGGDFRKIKSLSDVGRFYMKTHFTSPLTCGVLWKAWCVSGGNAKIIVEVRSGGQSAGRQH